MSGSKNRSLDIILRHLWSEGNILIRRSYLENFQLHKGIFEISETDTLFLFINLLGQLATVAMLVLKSSYLL